MNRPAPNLCIFHPGALGDGLLSLDALRRLRQVYSHHRLIWFGHKQLGDVYVNAHEVHESYSFDRIPMWSLNGGETLQSEFFKSVFRQCERAVGWLNDSDGKWQRWIESLGITQSIFLSPHDPILLSHHMVDRFLETIHPWVSKKPGKFYQKNNKVPQDVLLVLKKNKKARNYLSSEGMIILHPGSGGSYKCASAELLANIFKACESRFHGRICLLGGPADTRPLKKLESVLGQDVAILEGLTLSSVVDYLQSASLFIGHDSGISHLASRLGVPSVLLFGPTDPGKWAPRGNHVAVIENSCHCRQSKAFDQCLNKPCLSFSVETVMARVLKFLDHKKFDVSLVNLESRNRPSSSSCLG